jgi:hypothetical protein
MFNSPGELGAKTGSKLHPPSLVQRDFFTSPVSNTFHHETHTKKFQKTSNTVTYGMIPV